MKDFSYAREDDYEPEEGGEMPTSARWCPDNRHIYIIRDDNRKLRNFWVINSLGDYPSLKEYKYEFPGDKYVTQNDLTVIDIVAVSYTHLDVAQDEAHPFVVQTHLGEVMVLGTAFNVNAYANARVCYTTLVRGKVQFSAPNVGTVTLQPGEQAIVSANGTEKRTVDLDEYIGWVDVYKRQLIAFPHFDNTQCQKLLF